jgi:tetratricopeptide (TPR) repeat protein
MKSTTKYQIVLSIAAIAAGIYLFTLPKGTIKKTEQASSKDTAMAASNQKESPEVSKLHSKEVSANDNNKLKELTKKYYKFYNSEKKVIFADSLAQQYRKIHWYDSATKYIEVILAERKDPETFLKAGDFYFEAYSFSDSPERGKWNENARTYYNKAIDLDNKNYDARCKLAMTYVGGENPMQGIGILKAVLKDDPKNETAIYQLGVLSLQSSQYEKALDRFKELVKVNPSNANAHYYMGVAYDNLGKNEEAIKALEKAKELETDKAFRAAVEDYLEELKK